MSDQQVKEFFSSVLEGGPADHLDLDRAVAAGRRRRRIRTATTLASAAAVLFVVGALVVSALPDGGRSDLGGATFSPSPSATTPSSTLGSDVIVPGTDADWARALEPYLPAGTQTPAVTSTASRSLGIVRAVFRYVADGRTTALVITAYEPWRPTRDQVYDELKAGCTIAGITCEKTVDAASGPVFVRRSDDGTKVSVSSVRDSGAVVTVDSWNGDTDQTQVLPGSGAPGFSSAEDVLALAGFAASVPLPVGVVPTPTPVPTADATTPDPQPTPIGPGPTPIGTGEPTSTPKPAGLVGTVASEACVRGTTFRYDAPRAITGEVLQYVVCSFEAGGTLVPYSVSPVDGARFRDLDAALRLGSEARSGVCLSTGVILIRPAFVQTADGWFWVQIPEDRCGQPQQQSRDAIAALVSSG